MTLDQARRRLTHPVPAEEADAEAPPLLRETGLLVDGEVPLDQAASGRTPQPGPPRPDGSYNPHGLRDGYAPEKPVDLAKWKQADYGHMAHAHEVAQTDETKPWWRQAGNWVSDRLDNVVSTIAGGWAAWKLRHLKFTRLEDGHISVRAETQPGTRLDYRELVSEEGFSFKGTRYNPETVAGITSEGLLRSAASMGNLVMAGTVSLVQNLWEFGTNPAEGKTFWDRTVKNREFWVSTLVDTVVSVAVGVAAAAVVAGAIAGLVALGFTAAASAPLWLTVGVTTGLAVYLGSQIEAWGVPEILKAEINRGLDSISERR